MEHENTKLSTHSREVGTRRFKVPSGLPIMVDAYNTITTAAKLSSLLRCFHVSVRARALSQYGDKRSQRQTASSHEITVVGALKDITDYIQPAGLAVIQYVVRCTKCHF